MSILGTILFCLKLARILKRSFVWILPSAVQFRSLLLMLFRFQSSMLLMSIGLPRYLLSHLLIWMQLWLFSYFLVYWTMTVLLHYWIHPIWITASFILPSMPPIQPSSMHLYQLCLSLLYLHMSFLACLMFSSLDQKAV